MDSAKFQSKTVGCWYYGAWEKITLFYPIIDKHGIPPEQHPAVKEDEWLASPDTILVGNNGRKGWKQGYTRNVVINYLRINGPAIVSQIASDVQGTSVQITGVLRRNPDVFKIIDYQVVRSDGWQMTKAAVWGLVEDEE